MGSCDSQGSVCCSHAGVRTKMLPQSGRRYCTRLIILCPQQAATGYSISVLVTYAGSSAKPRLQEIHPEKAVRIPTSRSSSVDLYHWRSNLRSSKRFLMFRSRSAAKQLGGCLNSQQAVLATRNDAKPLEKLAPSMVRGLLAFS